MKFHVPIPRNALFLATLLILLLVPWWNVDAQSEGPHPTPDPENGWSGDVEGKAVNRTRNDAVTETLDVMLHGWDQNGQERVMLHGQSNPDGSFRFENVSFYPAVAYAVMATYREVAYLSEAAQVEEGQNLLTLDVPVYETTADTGQVRIERKHTLFFFDHTGLSVSEVYLLSNTGLSTIKDTETLASGRKGALTFPLPEASTNVEFNTRTPDRFIQLPNGFLDTNPVPPGIQVSQVMVSYNLPYESGMTFTYQAPYTTGGISWLLQQGSGVTLQGEGISSLGKRSMGEGMDFEIFSSEGMEPGEMVQVKLSGNPNVEMESSSTTSGLGEANSKLALAFGGLVLGLALLGVGFWWWRRPDGQEAEANDSDSRPVEPNLDDLISRIVLLDSAFERGEILEGTYRAERAALLRAAEKASVTNG